MTPRSLVWRDAARRLPQLMTGLVLVGVGATLMIDARLGLDPWGVLHQGLSRRTGVPIGTVSILVGLVLFVAWFPLGQRPGVGTVINVITIGTAIDLFVHIPFAPQALALRLLACVSGVLIIGLGGGLYIGAGLGTGPRDGIMTGLVARGYPLRTVRTLIELSVLAGGWFLGGTVGLGTVLFAVTIGPVLHVTLAHCDRGPLVATPVAASVGVVPGR